MSSRVLIVNADDFGLTPGTNRAIAALLRQRLVTSASLIAPARYAQEARDIAAAEGFSVGVHWALHAEWPQETWRTLSKAGPLLEDAKRLAKEARGADVRRELAAQAAWLLDAGCAVDHADCHGTALYGLNRRLFFLSALRLCRKQGLPFRFPRRADFLSRMLGHPAPAYVRAAHRVIVGIADGMGVRLPDDMVSDPRAADDIAGYDDLRGFYLDALRRAGPGITEVFLHPSEPEVPPHAPPGAWRKRAYEYRLLRDGDLLRLAEQEGFTLVSWADLRGTPST